MDESGSEPVKEARALWVPRARATWLLVVLIVLLLVAGGIAALYWAIGPDSPTARNEFARTVVQILGGGALLTRLYFTAQTLQVNRRTLQHNFDTQEENQQANRSESVAYVSAVARLGAATQARSACSCDPLYFCAVAFRDGNDLSYPT